MRIMITGGGTGGHTSPALAVYEELSRRDPRLRTQWVGCRGKIEERVCRQRAIPFRSLPISGWPRKRSLRQVWVGARLAISLLRAALLIRSFKPQVVFGVGGYVSLPLMMAAQRMGIPTVIHEQNRRLGMANQMLAPRASRIYLSFPDTRGDYPRERAAFVGNPVRPEFVMPPSREEACAAFQLDPGKPVVLVCGGSQGARQINEAVEARLDDWLAQGIQLIWATGQGEIDGLRKRTDGVGGTLRLHAFLDNMVAACVAADLVVGRSGASTTAELAVLGKPSILVPYPLATDNHQAQNAAAFEEAGAGRVIVDAECTGDTLYDAVSEMLGNRAALSQMGHAARTLARPVAADAISEGIMMLVFGETSEGAEGPEHDAVEEDGANLESS
jgi:UDP-N-acetylglucosamine--N-acetylmuramyl-(pentapeptide) pyrophosphoryl-undecaprenol N-acetylglucosamine transferase